MCPNSNTCGYTQRYSKAHARAMNKGGVGGRLAPSPVGDIAEIALGVRMGYPGVLHPRDRQFVGRSGEASVAPTPLGEGAAGHGALEVLLLDQGGIWGAARRCLLLRWAETEESSTGKVCTILPELHATGTEQLTARDKGGAGWEFKASFKKFLHCVHTNEKAQS